MSCLLKYAQITASAANAMIVASTTDRTPCAETSIPKNLIVILVKERTSPLENEK